MASTEGCGDERTPIMVPARRVPARTRGWARPAQRGGAQTGAISLLAAICAMVAMFVVATRVHPETTYGFDAVASLSAERIRDDPHGVMRDTFGSRVDPVELLWQKPRDPKALLFLAHGCNHAATDFFPASETCPTCAGLPEETRVVAKALARGYVVAAVSSRGACWDATVDAHRVVRALSRVSRLVPELAGKPTFAFGASSGGAFVGALPFYGAVDGVVSQISSIRLPSRLRDAASLGEELRAQGGRGDYPPVVFSHMSRDVLTGELVDRSRAYLESVGVPVRVTELDPQPVDDGFFHRRIVRAVPADAHGDGAGLEPVVRLAESKAMAAKLRDAGMLDTEGYLRDDPRASDWRSALGADAKAMGDSMRPDASGLSEVLNVAYASHELSADGFDGDMKWLEDQRKARVAAGKAARAERVAAAGGARGEVLAKDTSPVGGDDETASIPRDAENAETRRARDSNRRGRDADVAR